MKKHTLFSIATLLCLSLLSSQAEFSAQTFAPVPHSPLDTIHSIMEQVDEAASQVEEQKRQETLFEQMMEVMAEQQKRLDEPVDSLIQDLPFLLPGADAGDTADAEAPAETETEAEAETEAETETETEALPEETEFDPVEMGALLPDPSTALPEDETETETEEEKQDSEEDTGTDDSVMVSRHGTFAVPKIEGLNEARINLYDYRMLRAIPLARLPKDLHILHRQLQEQVDAYDGTWSVYVQNLNTGQALVVHDRPLRSASVIKLFIMETVYEAFDRGDLPRNEDTAYFLRSMIVISSNESSNRLLSLLGDGDIAAGIAQVNEFIRLHGFSDQTALFNGFEDPNTYVNPDQANRVMAKDVGLLLSRVYNRAFLSRKVCNEIESMMLEQATRYKIPRGLPEGVECGNKSGETETIANDAAVIYGPTTDYILVVLSNDWSSEDTANAQIAEVSKTVYDFFEQ